jgi:hypothetical protein
MRFIFAAAALLATLVGAQTIDPNSVPLATRDQWCVSQQASCPELCAQQSPTGSLSTASNTCDPKTLDYSCVCASGLAPNASQYSQTIPYFICTEYNNQCVSACGQDNACASACRQDHPCGAKDPTRVNVTSTSATASATSSTASSTGFDTFGGSGSSSHSSSAVKIAAYNIASTYGFAAVVGGLFVGFGLML